MHPTGLLCPWDSPGKNTGVGFMPPSRGSSHPGIEPISLMSPTLAGGFFTTRATWEALYLLSLYLLIISPNYTHTLATFVSKQSKQTDAPLKFLCTWKISLLFSYSGKRVWLKWQCSKIKSIKQVKNCSRDKFEHSANLIYSISNCCRWFVAWAQIYWVDRKSMIFTVSWPRGNPMVKCLSFFSIFQQRRIFSSKED